MHTHSATYTRSHAQGVSYSRPHTCCASHTLLAHSQCNLHPTHTCAAQPTSRLHAHGAKVHPASTRTAPGAHTLSPFGARAAQTTPCSHTRRANYTPLTHPRCDLHLAYTRTRQPTPGSHAHGATYTLLTHTVQPTPLSSTRNANYTPLTHARRGGTRVCKQPVQPPQPPPPRAVFTHVPDKAFLFILELF